MHRAIFAIALVSLSACGGPATGAIQPHRAFTINREIGLRVPRDLTVDGSGNVYVFDYGDYVISKFDSSGGLLGEFGGTGEGEGRFQHLMAIRAFGDSLLALDAGALSVFDLSGVLRSYGPFTDTVTCDLPRIHTNGNWAGQWIFDETAEKILTYRGIDGGEEYRVAGHDLAEFFPGVEPGGFFFINPTQDRSYYYDFLPDGRLVWAASDDLRVWVGSGDGAVVLFESDALPLPFPAEEVQAMRETQADLGPPLFMNVPEDYQLIQHLLVDEEGDLWIYLMTSDRTGLLHLSDRGGELGFYTVEADFDMLSVRMAAAGGRLYFLVGGREAAEIFVVDRP